VRDYARGLVLGPSPSHRAGARWAPPSPACGRGDSPNDRVFREAAEAGAAAAYEIAVATIGRKASDEAVERDGAFHPRQGCAQAHVHAGAEGNVAVGRARDVEAVRIGEFGRVAVGRTDADMDVGAGRQRFAADVGVGRESTVAELVRTFEAQS